MSDQVVEVVRAVAVTRCFEQLLPGPHLPLDVGAGLGQQRFQDRLRGCSGAIDAREGEGAGAEGFFEERQTDSFGTAHFFERGGGPGFAFNHLGVKGQTDGDDLSVLGKLGN